MNEISISKNSKVKIAFRLEKDADDYPPADWEHIWTNDEGGGVYEIDNIPFFVKSIAVGDKVRAEPIGQELVFKELVETSGHSTLRVLVSDPGDTQRFRDELRKLGCESELSHIQGLFAVDVPPNVNYSPVREFLSREEDSGSLGYEEAALAHNS